MSGWTRVYLEGQDGGLRYFSDKRHQLLKGVRAPCRHRLLAEAHPDHIIVAFIILFLGLFRHGVATPSSRPVGSLFAMFLLDKDIEVLVTTRRDLFENYVHDADAKGALPHESVRTVDGVRRGSHTLYVRSRWRSSLPADLLTDNIYLYGSLYLYFDAIPGSRPPQEANIAGLRMVRSDQKRDYVVFEVKLRENPMFLGHCASSARDGRSRSR